MEKNIEVFLQNQFIRSRQRLRLYTSKGSWTYPQRPVVMKTRKIWKDFLMGQRNNRWFILSGIRGVGKTTVLAQTYFELFSEISKDDPRRIVYISMDEVTNTLGANLNDIFIAYEKLLGKSLEELDDNLYIFLDEVHYDPNWAQTLKVIYDRTDKILVYCSGSSAVALRTNPDTVRRAKMERLFPNCYTEYAMMDKNVFPIAGMKQLIRNILFNSENAEQVYERLQNVQQDISKYWSRVDDTTIDRYIRVGTLPFALKIETEEEIFEKVSLILDRVIQEDIMVTDNYDSTSLPLFNRLLFILSDSDTLSLEKIANTLQRSRPLISQMLSSFEKAEILIRILPYGNQMNQSRKPSKYLFLSPAFRAAYQNILTNPNSYSTKRGKLLEDLIGLYLYRISSNESPYKIFYDADPNGADFIVNNLNDQSNIVFEVGAGDKDFGQVMNTMKKVQSKYGLVISNSDLELSRDRNAVKIPLKTFLLI